MMLSLAFSRGGVGPHELTYVSLFMMYFRVFVVIHYITYLSCFALLFQEVGLISPHEVVGVIIRKIIYAAFSTACN